ncbi:MAG: VWA domain-containing protein [Acidobacteriota bacterium]
MKLRSLLSVALSLLFLISTFAKPQTEKPKDNPPPSQSEKTPVQTHPAEQEDVVKLGVTLVQVDAVVTDKNGKYINDLKPEDFEIYEDGRKQQITNFSYVAIATKAPAKIESNKTDNKNAAIIPPTRLRPEQVGRTIALVVDDLSLSFESTHHVRQTLKKFVDQQMQPGDLVAIIRTGAGMGALQQFTSDKRQLYAAIERVRWNMNGAGGISAFAPIEQTPEEQAQQTLNREREARGTRSANDEQRERRSGDIDQFREEIFSVGTLGALNFIVRGLRDLPGRKSVILFSDGISLFTRGENNIRVVEAMRRLTDLANRAAVVVYTIDARGLVVTGPTAADNFNGLSQQEVSNRLQERDDKLFESQQGLNYLAYQTGGFFLRNSNDLTKGVTRALEDQQGYYLLGYIPQDSTFKPVAGRRAFHKLTIKVKRPDLSVRYRTGFYGIPDVEAKPASRTPEQRIVSALISPFASGDVPLRLTSLFGYDEKIGHFMRSLLHIDTRALKYTEEANGNKKAVVDIAAVTFKDDGKPIDQFLRSYAIGVTQLNFERFTKQGLIYSIILPVKKPGAYQLRVAVRDENSGLLGSANQFIEVPDVKKGRLTVSGITAQGYSAANARAAAANTDPALLAKESAQVLTEDHPQWGPALRRFENSMELSYSFLIYNARLDDKTRQPQIEAQVILWKDGTAIYRGHPAMLDIDPSQDLKRILTGGRLNFTKLDVGEYVLQVLVTDKLAKEKYRTATQWVDFEIVK